MAGSYGELKFTFAKETGSSTGEIKPYATATVELTYGAKFKENKGFIWDWSKDDGYYIGVDAGKLAMDGTQAWRLALKEFKIVGENWEIDLIKADAFGDYAKSA